LSRPELDVCWTPFVCPSASVVIFEEPFNTAALSSVSSKTVLIGDPGGDRSFSLSIEF
jgi:hypothetical protein